MNLLCCFTLDQREWLIYFDPWLVFAFVFPAFVVFLPSLPFMLSVVSDEQANRSTVFKLTGVTVAFVFFELLGVFPPYGEVFDLLDWFRG